MTTNALPIDITVAYRDEVDFRVTIEQALKETFRNTEGKKFKVWITVEEVRDDPK